MGKQENKNQYLQENYHQMKEIKTRKMNKKGKELYNLL